MKAPILALALALVSLSGLWAQKASPLEDVVYLKNGSIIRGQIMEQLPDRGIKIESGRNLWFFAMSDIEKISKEPLYKVEGGKAQGNEEEVEEGARYQGAVEAGIIIGVGDVPLSAIQLRSAHGVLVNEALFIGGGLGLRFNFEETGHLPLFLRLAYAKPQGNFRPFGRLDVGYSLDLSDLFYGYSNGLNLQAVVGTKFKLGKHLGSVGLGYDLQRASLFIPGLPRLTDVNTHGLVISLGFEF